MASSDGIIIVTCSNGKVGQAIMHRFLGRFGQVVGLARKAESPPPPVARAWQSSSRRTLGQSAGGADVS